MSARVERPIVRTEFFVRGTVLKWSGDITSNTWPSSAGGPRPSSSTMVLCVSMLPAQPGTIAALAARHKPTAWWQAYPPVVEGATGRDPTCGIVRALQIGEAGLIMAPARRELRVARVKGEARPAGRNATNAQQELVAGPARFYPDLSAKAVSLLKRDYFRRREFRAGDWLARPGLALPGAFFVESGLVSATDESAIDFIWPGLVFNPGSTFGEYALIEGAKAFPSTLRALTDVTSWYISPEYFQKALQRKGDDLVGLDTLVRQRVALDVLLPDVVRALNRYPPAAAVPACRLVELAQRAEVHEISPGIDVKRQLKDGDWVLVATGEVESDGLRIPQGSTFIFRGGTSAPLRTAGRPRAGDKTQIVVLRKSIHVEAGRK